MEILLATHVDGRPTNYVETFRGVTRILEADGLQYCFCGTLARNMYLRPRFTDEIEVLSITEEVENIKALLASEDLAGKPGSVRLQLNSSPNPRHLYMLANYRQLTLFGVSARFVCPLALAWDYLESNTPYAESDVGELLLHGHVLASDIQPLLEQHHSSQALEKLAQVCDDVSKGRYSGTYSDSVRARLHRLKR